VQEFVSYCRLVKWAKESAGKRYGTSGTKSGNAYLQWAFSEAAVLFLRANPAGQKSRTRLEKKQSKGKALTILAHKLARAVYYMLQRKTAFDLPTFLRG
jgi:transposase